MYWSDGDYSDYESNWEHYNNKTDNMGFCGDKSSVQIDVGPVLDDEGTFYFNVTDDTINNLASVNCSVYRVDEERVSLSNSALTRVQRSISHRDWSRIISAVSGI